MWRSVPINRIFTIHYDIDGNGTKELIIADGENGGDQILFLILGIMTYTIMTERRLFIFSRR